MKRLTKWWAPALALLVPPGLSLAKELDASHPRRTWDVTAQAGLITFTGQGARYTNPGIAYGVLGGLDFTPAVGGELSYQGAAYDTDDRVTPQSGSIAIMEHGGQAIAKVGPQLGGGWQPYALGGFGISFLNVIDRETAFGLVDDATLIKLPMGAGLDWEVPAARDNPAQFTLGARATYNLALDSGAFPATDKASSSSQFLATLQLGASF
ncbi:outer membrane beta-barrel protein [Myxococcaceae bacterium GXIMD 01537]